MSELTPILLERDNINDEVVTLIQRYVQNGEMVEAGTLIAEIETSKANVEVNAPQSGYLYWGFEEKAYIPVSEAIGIISSQPVPEGSIAGMFGRKSKDTSTPSHPHVPVPIGTRDATINSCRQDTTTSEGAKPAFPSTTNYVQRFSRRAQELIREHDVPIERFATFSLVRVDDVLAVLQGRSIQNGAGISEYMPEIQSLKATEAKAIAMTKVPTTEISLSRMKRSEIQSLTSGARNVLPSMVSVTCLTHGLRAALQANPIVAGNLGAVIVFEVARLLRKYPAFNATYRTDTMLVYEQKNVGYAMDDGRGLKVAVLQNCDRKSLAEITTELRALTVAYLDDKLTPAQISGGTFTISDLSSMGVSGFMPLISEDQGAILGVGGEQFLPGSRNGLYTLTLTFDHQLSEGRTAALFLNDLKDRLRNYEKAMEGAILPPAIHCARCGRGIEDLPDANAYMVPSAVPAGHLCNLCVAGF